MRLTVSFACQKMFHGWSCRTIDLFTSACGTRNNFALHTDLQTLSLQVTLTWSSDNFFLCLRWPSANVCFANVFDS